MRLIAFFDRAVSDIIHFSPSLPFLDSIMIFITKLGDGGFIWLFVIAIMLFTKRYRKIGLIALISLTICFFSGNYFIKPLVGRIRPCNVDMDLVMLVPRLIDFSFPSMHTATAFSCAVVFLKGDKAIGIVSILLATLVGVSRIYLHLHYASDVVFGILYGTIIAILTLKVSRVVMQRSAK